MSHTEQVLLATTDTAESLCTSVRVALETARGAAHLKDDLQQGHWSRCLPGPGEDGVEIYGQAKKKWRDRTKWKMPEQRDKESLCRANLRNVKEQ